MAGGFVVLVLHRHPVNNVVELNSTRFLGDNWDIVGIPLDEHLPFLDLPALGNGNDRTDDHIVAFQFAAVFLVHNQDHPIFVEDDAVFILQLHPANILKLHNAIIACLDLGLLEHR